MRKSVEAEEYHSKDFEWEELKNLVESDPSLSHHVRFRHDHESQGHDLGEDRDSFAQVDPQAWQNFHARHSSGKFFKERRYLLKEFPELLPHGENSKLLEVGCGNGSTVLPILRGCQNLTVYACDCSTEALVRTKENIDHSTVTSDNFHSFCCDFSRFEFPKWLACDHCRENVLDKQIGSHSDASCPSHELSSVQPTEEHRSADVSSKSPSTGDQCCIGGVDFVTLIFTLSAVPQKRMPRAIKECYSVLKPGGLLLFRDYGLYDMTMLRFEPEKCVGFREYMRSDGTLSYFFCLDTVKRLFTGAGFIEVELEYCCVKSVNRRKGKMMNRVWVHGKFQKPK
ncbi:PREDICTED: methyltransferase-like protein 6 [Tarenaya hassleriana]|uniref:methyltransferase-like protein 6 n=1 Tax=Tarenaya hassleriana TaxID=28532 RepID=UPI00053C4F11|nr:PREDICTED: methyltransferase-like protein 6 [Tarenaya hassleriana]